MQSEKSIQLNKLEMNIWILLATTVVLSQTSGPTYVPYGPHILANWLKISTEIPMRLFVLIFRQSLKLKYYIFSQ